MSPDSSLRQPDVRCPTDAQIRLELRTRVQPFMCVLHRSFGIKPMTRWGIRCVLVRDMTDTMYSPKSPPHVSHDRCTELVVEYIETHWGPTVLSDDLLAALA